MFIVLSAICTSFMLMHLWFNRLCAYVFRLIDITCNIPHCSGNCFLRISNFRYRIRDSKFEYFMFFFLDLATVEKKMVSGQYLFLSEFVKDITKIFDNCRYYNPRDSPFYQCAEVLETFFVQKLKLIKDKI